MTAVDRNTVTACRPPVLDRLTAALARAVGATDITSEGNQA